MTRVLTARSASISDHNVLLSALPQEAPDIRSYQVTVPRDYRFGPFDGSGEIETEHGTVRFTFRGEKVGPLYCASDTAVFRRKTSGVEASPIASIYLRHSHESEIDNVRVTSDGASFIVGEMTKLKPGTTRLTLTVLPLDEGDCLRGAMRICTNLNEGQSLELRWFVAK